MKEKKIKHICNIIVTFPLKLITFFITTIMLPLLWLCEEDLTIKEYFTYWYDVFFNKHS